MRRLLLCLATLPCAWAGASTDANAAAKLASSVYLASTPASPIYGDSVTIGALALGADGAPVPTGTVRLYTAPLSLDESSVDLGTITLDGSGHGVLTTTYAARTYAIGAVYSGDSIYQPALAKVFTMTIGKAGTAVTLDATPAQMERPVTLTAAVSLVNWAKASVSGTVGFSSNGSPISGCTALPVKGGTAICTTVFSKAGSVAIGAAYTGDANTDASSGSMQVTVGRMMASVYLAAAPALPVYGEPLTVSALVLGAQGAAAPNGTVTLSEGGAALATAPLGSDGRARMSPALRAGSHNIAATYSGDANYASVAAASLNLAIASAATTTALSASTGGPFVATVSVQAPGAGAPTGTVRFFNSGAVFAAVPLVSQVATLPLTSQTGNITAVYSGDNNFIGSASPPVPVAPALAQMILTSDHNPGIAGQLLTFTVYVTPGTGRAMPTGSVELRDNDIARGTLVLNSGSASFQASLAAGTHVMAASYSGDANYPAASATLSQVVDKSAPPLTVSADPSATVFGQPVTFTAQLAGPDGSAIQFLDGPTAIGSATLSGGIASLTIAAMPAGSHAISATWAGDATSATATSTALPYIVDKARTSTRASCGAATLTSAVAVLAPGGGVPTGTVRFVDAATNAILSTVILSGGRATAPLPAAAHAVVAVYSGDANFLASNSPGFVVLAAANAASYTTESFAPDEIVTLFGSNLSAETVTAMPEPASLLAGVSVKITDGAGVSQPANLLYVSPSQASILMPADLAPGQGTISLTNSGGPGGASTITLGRVAPGLFPVGQVLRIHPDGTRDPLEDFSRPIDLGAAGDRVYLVLYGTGVRHFTTNPVAAIAGQTIPVDFAGAQGFFPGLDQINVLLPSSLRGSGTVLLKVMADGVSSNALPVTFL